MFRRILLSTKQLLRSRVYAQNSNNQFEETKSKFQFTRGFSNSRCDYENFKWFDNAIAAKHQEREKGFDSTDKVDFYEDPEFNWASYPLAGIHQGFEHLSGSYLLSSNGEVDFYQDESSEGVNFNFEWNNYQVKMQGKDQLLRMNEPKKGVYMLHTDGSYFPDKKVVICAGIVRDENFKVRFGITQKHEGIERKNGIFFSEITAMKTLLDLCVAHGLKNVASYSDYRTGVKQLNEGVTNNEERAMLVDILSYREQIPDHTFSFTPRELNRAANRLTQIGCNFNFEYFEGYPSIDGRKIN